MAISFIDGFDLYNGVGTGTGVQSKWQVINSVGGSSSMVAGRFGGQALRLQGGTSMIYGRPIPVTSTYAIGLAKRVTSFRSSDVDLASSAIALWSGTTAQCGIKVDALGAMAAYRLTAQQGGGTLLGKSAAGKIILNTWHYVEAEFVIHDTTGRITVWVDGEQVLNLTNVDTKNHATLATADLLHLGSTWNGSGASTQWDADDLYFCDTAARLGERRISALMPSADVAQGFTPNSGTANFSRVNEALPDGDTSYVSASTVGATDTYAFADMAVTPELIDAVQLSTLATKTDAATRAIALQVKSGTTTSDGPDFYLSNGYTRKERLLMTNPDTGLPWTMAQVNAMQGGPKVTI